MYMAPIDKANAVALSVLPLQRRGVVGPAPSNEAFPRLVRFTLATVGVTMLAALIYLVGAMALALSPAVANGEASLVATVTAIGLHRRWSSDGHGTASVVMIAAGAYVLNAGWVWLAVTACAEAVWTPVTPMLFGTPLATFAAARRWLF